MNNLLSSPNRSSIDYATSIGAAEGKERLSHSILNLGIRSQEGLGLPGPLTKVITGKKIIEQVIERAR